LLCIVAEPTVLGAITTRRIFELARELPIAVKEIGVVFNRTKEVGHLGPKLDQIEVFGYVPEDKEILDVLMDRKSIFELSMNNPAFMSIQTMLEQKLGKLQIGK
jgi:CO dehydrogenase nickel-insertion accessory protein CooC1